MAKNFTQNSITFAFVLLCAFIGGLINTGISVLFSWLCVVALFLLGLILALNFARGKGLKGSVIALIWIVILIPLSVIGGCGLTALGMQIGGMFFR